MNKKQTTNEFFNRENYRTVYERGLQQARKDIYIASPGLNKNKVWRLIALVEEQQTSGAIGDDHNVARWGLSPDLR